MFGSVLKAKYSSTYIPVLQYLAVSIAVPTKKYCVDSGEDDRNFLSAGNKKIKRFCQFKEKQ